jgi:formylglycine-generating enzyme required for sulfatase activity
LFWAAGLGIIGILLFLVFQGAKRLLPPAAEAFVRVTQIAPGDEMVLVKVPAGRFEMGSEDGYDNERPVHRVNVPEFWMDQTEVTNAMYQACVDAGACRLPREEEFIMDPALRQLPVVYVSWEDAQTYCQWVGRELPSEAMWERAARGGLVGKRYPWGDQDPVCQLGASNGAQMAGCGGGPVAVRSFQSNAYGLFDMAGNVSEWVEDGYEAYPGGDRDADAAFGGGDRVARVGSFYDDRDDIRNAVRLGMDPNERVDSIGFRCVFLP